jgi:DNA-binding MarR family transcriptional regulator
MVQAAERLHEGEPVTIGMRAVLEHLSLNGPATVPAIARSREVSRQHIQTLVNDLVAGGLAALEPNPAHQRSALVRLTPEGKAAIGRMKRRERRIFDALELDAGEGEIRRATKTIREVRRSLGGGR